MTSMCLEMESDYNKHVLSWAEETVYFVCSCVVEGRLVCCALHVLQSPEPDNTVVRLKQRLKITSSRGELLHA